MTGWEPVLVLVAGVLAGTINTVVGSGTLISFPVLLAVGLPPISANVSNTVGLFPGAFVGAYGYRRELTGQRPRAITMGSASIIGAIGGALLLLVLPPNAFRAIVPALIVLSLVLVVFGSKITSWVGRTHHKSNERVSVPLYFTTMGTGVYGGYFGAAQGVLLMGFMGLFLDESLQRQNALKNVLAGLVNLVAAIVFAFTAPVNWAAAGIVAAGSIVGGVVGAKIGRRLPPAALRAVIVVVGLAAIVKLLV